MRGPIKFLEIGLAESQDATTVSSITALNASNERILSTGILRTIKDYVVAKHSLAKGSGYVRK